MSISLWLESLTMEETFFLTYGIIFGLMLLVFAPIAVWIDKKTNKGEKHK